MVLSAVNELYLEQKLMQLLVYELARHHFWSQLRAQCNNGVALETQTISLAHESFHRWIEWWCSDMRNDMILMN